MKCTLFADHPDDNSADFDTVRAWLERWREGVKVVDYATGGWEHLWDVEAPLNALQELPKRFFCASAWAEYPSTRAVSRTKREEDKPLFRAATELAVEPPVVDTAPAAPAQ